MLVEVRPKAKGEQFAGTVFVKYMEPCLECRAYLSVEKFIINSGVEGLKVHTIWGNNTLLQCEYCFYNTRNSTGTF
jgi:hypothetical protein